MLPTNIQIKGKELNKALSSETLERISGEITEYLTEQYGYCINGYGYDVIIDIDRIDWDVED